MSNREKADVLSYDACQMWGSERHEDSFAMYSHDRPANCFWRGFAEKCLDSGLTEDQTQSLMESSLMRHGLDQYDDQIEKLGAEFVSEYMIDWAKSEDKS